MKRRSMIIALSAILAFVSCSKERVSGHGPVTTETRTVSGFSAISASGSSNVYITQGAAFKVEVKGYSNLLPYYETRLVNNTLQVGYKQGVNVKNDNTEVYITMPVLDGLELSGSGDMHTNGTFTGNTVFRASITGSGNIHFSSGTTQQFYSTIEGSGNIYALNLVSDKAETTTTGSGNTEISAVSLLNVKITGSGNVYYHGTPQISTIISGSGKVLPR